LSLGTRRPESSYPGRTKSVSVARGWLRAWSREKWRRNSSMPQSKRAPKSRRPSKALSVLGIAGVSLAASTGGSTADMPFTPLAPATAGSLDDLFSRDSARFRVPTLDEEEITDVSLATFSLFDNDLGHSRSDIQLAVVRGCGCGGCRGCGGGCRGCGGGFRGCGVGACRGCAVGGCRGCAVGGCRWGWGGCGGCGGCGWGWGYGGGCCLSWGGCSLWC
jgi:hypothetical protein